MERKNAWLSYEEADEKEMEKLAKDYRAFLDAGKTERECVTELVREAEANGYVSLEAKQAAGEKIQPGDKIYAVGMKKIMALFHVGQEPLEKGMNILGAHIDSPRLDVKQNPLYEDTDLAYLDTHYYGGVKKYQWVALPLAIHGVIAKKDGSVVNVTIGEDENDPCKRGWQLSGKHRRKVGSGSSLQHSGQCDQVFRCRHGDFCGRVFL